MFLDAPECFLIGVLGTFAVLSESAILKIAMPLLPVERRRIENAGSFVSWDGVDRVQGILAVSRAFGDTFLKRSGVLTALPDVQRVDLNETPLRFLLVASDGFWDVFSNQAAIDAALVFLNDSASWHLVAQHLVTAAIQRGSVDNVSLLVLKLD
ncbi:hypothetical protein L596_014746 [Steinernema carpocapsae]|uniref:PPM-type phosphatase domain-containing protein n=1 Tax=Steinernema carpocapsae TaxID=34508 RepID=A0A4U5NDM1_STECR|nr:hypothetical protein L596_014746 [Steinernema carpocapsae]